MPKVSIVVPVYNVEKYIEKCIYSLFNQSLNDIEYIFVDDGCTDKSVDKILKILEKYPEREKQVKIISHKINKGVAAARKTGILEASGEYIIHCDPDDYVDLNMYEEMYLLAKKKDCDIVGCYIEIESKQTNFIIKKIYEKTPIKCLKKIYKKNHDISSLCDKLISRKIIFDNKIFPFEGCDYAEDLGCVIRALYYANSITLIKKPFYHYRRREKSITSSEKNKFFHMRIKLLLELEKFLSSTSISYKLLINALKFNTKLIYKDSFSYPSKEWWNLFRNSHKYIIFYNLYSWKSRIIMMALMQSFITYKIGKKFIKSL